MDKEVTNEKLVEMIRAGVRTSENLELLYTRNLPLIRIFVSPYLAYESQDDILQEAFFGLVKAVQGYETDKNIKFMTFAKFWIKQAVRKYLEDCGSLIRLPEMQWQNAVKCRNATHKLQQIYCRNPTDEEVAEVSGLSLQSTKKARQFNTILSLDRPIEKEGNGSLGDFIPGPQDVEDEVTSRLYAAHEQQVIWEIVGRLAEKQRLVIHKYYREGMTLSQIADDLGISIERTRQYRAKGLRELRRVKVVRELTARLEGLEAYSYKNSFKGFRRRGSMVEIIAIERAAILDKCANAILQN